ncbi:glycoside hydrolase family 75 protein [Aspergillus ibericus CBS 121593]|uniref:Endo-chitosanase n=1 Tax=Aspergillus ibericus CBS 121593 TaxID=1448316 RepID=A0A395GXL1_9EURO|nr:Chitosanase-domain-containing protein [Aspergillus ibericus CBS 121593]RAL00090.1 Chitosanase-domain-containing protein [Aspergillus ibericus CBS 121593]
MALKTTLNLAVMALAGSSMAQSVDGSKYDHPNAGPPASFFAAATTLPVSALQAAAAKASVVPAKATYPVNTDKNSPLSTIHSDWASFSEGASFSWVADMDVDCDGKDYHCKGNGDGQPGTNWGALAAYEVPWIVIPDHFLKANEKALPGNNLAAVICNGKMYYGILGDSNGDNPEVTGEASWLMARTCFPNEDLDGANGHVPADVTYIVFTGKDAVVPSSALNNNYITNFSTLRSMGDKLVGALASKLGLSGSSSGSGSGSGSGSSSTCSWEGHCQGATCSSDNDCSDDLVCSSGVCSSGSVASKTTLTTSAATATATCSWEGHCQGASCSSDNDCSDALVCKSGTCASGSAAAQPTCSWKGHCEGASCSSDNDCSDDLVCNSGSCSSA